MKYSVIIGLSKNCFEEKRFAFVLSSIKRAFLNDRPLIERTNDYEILIPYMLSEKEHQWPIDKVMDDIGKEYGIKPLIVPMPRNKYFSNSIQYNFGIRHAEGEYIIQTDTDVCWRDDMVININKILAHDSDAFIGCDFRFIKKEYSDYSDELFNQVVTGNVPEHKIKNMLADVDKGWFYGNLQVYKKSLIEEARGYDERMRNWGEWDNDWNLRARMRCMPYGLPQWSMHHLYHDSRPHNPYPEGWDFDSYHKLLISWGRDDKRFVKNDENWGTTESRYFKHEGWEDYPE